MAFVTDDALPGLKHSNLQLQHFSFRLKVLGRSGGTRNPTVSPKYSEALETEIKKRKGGNVRFATGCCRL